MILETHETHKGFKSFIGFVGLETYETHKVLATIFETRQYATALCKFRAGVR
jgi:hypothetical protein